MQQGWLTQADKMEADRTQVNTIEGTAGYGMTLNQYTAQGKTLSARMLRAKTYGQPVVTERPTV